MAVNYSRTCRFVVLDVDFWPSPHIAPLRVSHSCAPHGRETCNIQRPEDMQRATCKCIRTDNMPHEPQLKLWLAASTGRVASPRGALLRKSFLHRPTRAVPRAAASLLHIHACTPALARHTLMVPGSSIALLPSTSTHPPCYDRLPVSSDCPHPRTVQQAYGTCPDLP